MASSLRNSDRPSRSAMDNDPAASTCPRRRHTSATTPLSTRALRKLNTLTSGEANNTLRKWFRTAAGRRSAARRDKAVQNGFAAVGCLCRRVLCGEAVWTQGSESSAV